MSETTSNAAPATLRLLPLALLALGGVAGAVLLGDLLSFEALAEHRLDLLALRDSHYAVTLSLFLAVYFVIVAFSLPGATLSTLVGGFLFGTFPGVLYNVMAASLGALAIFAAARFGFGSRLAARMDASDGQVKRIKAGIDANQWEMLFLIRLVPIVPFFLANFLPALVGVPPGRFAITTFLGILPGAFVYTSMGAGLGSVLTRGERPDLGVVFEPQILAPLLGLSALAALPIVLRALRRRRAA
ncbi:TVP38/TMEM64 family protein [Tropicimonas sp. IMCC6043]|uniref:TVP38/TMEM64 family protein n=1 Tax=Tropicimonas sp. IMCC6043 TaxID=2510645 RepID=UPI00101C7265|nr:VTT domain-containing protein [Tropicimonas sp. IMCC6043]RYH08986.1 TVP38/TMEM64 family protein [Tropicimonas sp. IMCC6043]